MMHEEFLLINMLKHDPVKILNALVINGEKLEVLKTKFTWFYARGEHRPINRLTHSIF